MYALEQHIRKTFLLLGMSIATILCVHGQGTAPVTAVNCTPTSMFYAGQQIVLTFDTSVPVTTKLYLDASWGQTLLTSDTSTFEIPEFMSTQKGIITYRLFYEQQSLAHGQLTITANQQKAVTIASYIGPPSITAGGHDFSMQTVIATDCYDNPVATGTPVQMKRQFLAQQEKTTVLVKDLVAWKRHFSYPKSGRMLLTSEVGTTFSKEYTVEVFPHLPLDFQIFSERAHTYADGNQIVSLRTSMLRDMYDNVISDGALVKFIIRDTEGMLLSTQGMTIGGIANANIICPDHQQRWTVQAYVEGIAQSTPITLTFNAVLEEYAVTFTEDHRNIQVGPLTSFMQQLIPDGAWVKLAIYDATSTRITTQIRNSKDGMATFLLPANEYPCGTYRLEITALGVQKIYKDIQLP